MSEKIIKEAEAVVYALPPPEDETVKAQRKVLEEMSQWTGSKWPDGVRAFNSDLTEFNRAWNVLVKECVLSLLHLVRRIARFGAIE